MRSPKTKRVRKPYTTPVLTVHGDVREITRSANGNGAADGKVNGKKVFRTG